LAVSGKAGEEVVSQRMSQGSCDLHRASQCVRRGVVDQLQSLLVFRVVVHIDLESC
jgi:hypothetical protein